MLVDLEQIFSFLASKLPSDLVQSISAVMMPELMSRVINVWLDSEVPASLEDMGPFEAVIASAKQFCADLANLKYTGFSELEEWVENAPRVWLSKCRETALDTVRIKLSQGLGSPTLVERVEKQMVSRSEGKELSANGPSIAADQQGWDAAWSDEESQPSDAPLPSVEAPEGAGAAEDDGADAWGAWGDEDQAPEEKTQEEKTPAEAGDGGEEDDPSDAWGWGAEDAKEESNPEPDATKLAARQEGPTKEMVLKETYHISAMPEPVLAPHIRHTGRWGRP